MALIRSRGNKATEERFAAILRQYRVVGWRRHRPLPGKPDFIFPRAKLAVFIDGCFWHGCRTHCRLPKSNVQFWERKIDRNRKRDALVRQLLGIKGYRVLRFWEHSLARPGAVVSRLQQALAAESRKG